MGDAHLFVLCINQAFVGDPDHQHPKKIVWNTKCKCVLSQGFVDTWLADTATFCYAVKMSITTPSDDVITCK